MDALPILTKPSLSERLWIYLTASERAVILVLLCQEGSTQKLVYYVSHLLKGAECGYTDLKKLTMALTLMAR